MSFLFDIEQIAISLLGYPISYAELIGTIFGLISVYLASRANIWTWPTGILNELFLFALFYQVQLYADMLLQLYFFVVTLYGWYHWNQHPGIQPISRLGPAARWWGLGLLLAGSLLAGYALAQVDSWWPTLFPLPAAYPYVDSLVMVASVLATVLLARKQLESWMLWVLVDLISVGLFAVKGIYFLAVEYVIFLGLASFGWWQWHKAIQHD